VNEYFSVEQFEEVILKFQEDRAERDRFRMIGIWLILGGIALTLLSGDLMSNGVVVFYGLIVFGVWNLIKAYNIGQKNYYWTHTNSVKL
jgi:hypothetical protein